MKTLTMLKDFWNFLRLHKSWWLVPLVIVVLLLGGLLLFSRGSALSPFMYGP